jgi:hypothetical protein
MLPTFDPELTHALCHFEHLIPATYAAMEELSESWIDWPRHVEAMTEQEIAEGEAVGKGHGLYLPETAQIKLNASMTPIAIYLNFIHEHLHHAIPDATEQEINFAFVPLVYKQVTGRDVPESQGRSAGIIPDDDEPVY